MLGRALNALPSAACDLVDGANAVDVELVDPEQWLTSCDDDGLAAGQNLAVLGSEMIQFGQATPLGGGRFQLGRLLRGRGGTEWAAADHSDHDPFCLILPGNLQAIPSSRVDNRA